MHSGLWHTDEESAVVERVRKVYRIEVNRDKRSQLIIY